MFAYAFQRFQMRCDKKRLNAIFVKPAFPKQGHKLRPELQRETANFTNGKYTTSYEKTWSRDTN